MRARCARGSVQRPSRRRGCGPAAGVAAPRHRRSRRRRAGSSARRERQEQRAQAAQGRAGRGRAAAEEAARQKLEEQRKADERRKAEAERKAQEAAQAAQHAADAKEQSDLESELKRSLAAEEHVARSGPALANWQAQITAAISRAWLRPPTARAGIECVLNVTQVPGGR
jgi:colicin import membrane protein